MGTLRPRPWAEAADAPGSLGGASSFKAPSLTRTNSSMKSIKKSGSIKKKPTTQKKEAAPAPALVGLSRVAW